MTIRFFILQTHYRSTLDFGNEALQAAEKGLKRLWEAHELLKKLAGDLTANPASPGDPALDDPAMGERGATLRTYQLEFWNSTLKHDHDAELALAHQAQASKATDPVWLRRR